MTGSAKLVQLLSEPRRGILVFAREHPAKIIEDARYTSRVFGDILFGSLGKANMFLMKPFKEALEKVISEDEQGFTIDLSGETHTGNLRDLISAGYFPLAIGFRNETKTKQQLTVAIWIDQAVPIFFSNIDHSSLISISAFTRINEGVKESFVLPDDPKNTARSKNKCTK